MLEQNVNYEDFSSSGEQKADEQLLVRFFVKEREDKAQTLAQGRPIFKDTEYIEIRTMGRRDPLACRPATHKDKQRFPRHYEAFKQRVELPETGTPLSEWPQISRSQVEELAFMNIKTVEQLAEMADVHAGNFRFGLTLKNRAKTFLENSTETQLIAEKEALEERVGELENRLSQVLAQLEQTPAPVEETPAPVEEPEQPQESLASELDTPEPEQAAAEPATPRKRRPRRKTAEE